MTILDDIANHRREALEHGFALADLTYLVTMDQAEEMCEILKPTLADEAAVMMMDTCITAIKKGNVRVAQKLLPSHLWGVEIKLIEALEYEPT